MQVLSPEECRRFLESIEGIRQDALFTLALVLGPRRGELLGLKERDVDPDARRLVVGQVQRVTGLGPRCLRRRRPVVGAWSRCRGSAFVPSARNVYSRSRTSSFRERAGEKPGSSSLTGTAARSTATGSVNNSKRRLTTRACQRSDFTISDIGAPSLLLMQGVPSCVVMDVLGHSQIAVTLNTYTTSCPHWSTRRPRPWIERSFRLGAVARTAPGVPLGVQAKTLSGPWPRM